MNISKTVWGKYYWTVFHIASLGYPEKPLITDREKYKQFYISFGDVIPCQKCSKNYKRHLTELPIESYLENQRKLFQWTIMMHNIVNRELGKTQWEESYAYMYYSNFSDNDKKEIKQVEFEKHNEHDNMSKVEQINNVIIEHCVKNKESIKFSNYTFYIIFLNLIIAMLIVYFLIKYF